MCAYPTYILHLNMCVMEAPSSSYPNGAGFLQTADTSFTLVETTQAWVIRDGIGQSNESARTKLFCFYRKECVSYINSLFLLCCINI